MACNPSLKYTWTPHSDMPDRMCVLSITFPNGSTRSVDIDLPVAGFIVCFDLWERGLLIQQAFPMLTDDEREFILTGLTPEEWVEIWSNDKNEDD